MKTGDKVRLSDEGRMMFPEIGDKELTLIDHPSNIYPYAARGEEGEEGGSPFNEDELEVMEDEPEPETNEDLEWLLATARDAQWIFKHYAKLHSEKGTADGIYKSMFNLMIADRLADAIEANS